MRRAFTLVELLIAVAIVAVLAALLFPIFTRAKARAKNAVVTSNLRQCYVALELYVTDLNSDWSALPDRDSAWRILGPEITYDPADTWRHGKGWSPYRAMVGSFGYVNAEICQTKEGKATSCLPLFTTSIPLLASPFQSDHVIPPGEYISAVGEGAARVMMPERALAVFSDGHVKMKSITRPRSAFVWSVLFEDLGYGRSAK